MDIPQQTEKKHYFCRIDKVWNIAELFAVLFVVFFDAFCRFTTLFVMFILAPRKWIDLYADYLYSYAYLKTNSRETAEDIVQDTFLSAYKAKEQFKGDCHEKTWLTQILKNKIIDYYRKKNTYDHLDDYIEQSNDAFNDSFFDDPQHHGRWTMLVAPNLNANNVEEYMQSVEFEHTLLECLSKVPPKLHRVFVAKYLDDANSEQICKEYGLSASNYWVIIHRAKILLRTCLEHHGFWG